MEKDKAIVTGGCGFIGSHLVDALVEKGYKVEVIDSIDPKNEYINKNALYHKADITKLAEIKDIIKGAKFVFHLAAMPRVQYSIEHPRETHDSNVNGTLNILISAKEGGVKRVIFSSSSSVYGNQPILPLKESMFSKPLSPYALHKYIGELYCKLWNEIFGLETVCLRYFNVYGPRLNPDGAYALVIGKFLKQRQEGKNMTITGDGNQTRDFTNVKDVVRANILAAESNKVGKGEAINIGAGNNTSVNKIAELIGGSKEYIPPRLEPRDTLADNSLAFELLGWRPEVPLEKGISDIKKIWNIQ
ncbi:NAD-dependent epimerase/dehydratase family protein [Candidatus Pacearchaeota archaeon]|nr:NAD-dependent epimerase/dehydratase family protein [Candidatus Pacearchaeota archaeon]